MMRDGCAYASGVWHGFHSTSLVAMVNPMAGESLDTTPPYQQDTGSAGLLGIWQAYQQLQQHQVAPTANRHENKFGGGSGKKRGGVGGGEARRGKNNKKRKK